MIHTVLIAEDEAFIANLYKEELERHDLRAFVAGNGKEAIDLLEKQAFDLLLLDLLMPVLDGYGVLAYVKEHAPTMPVMVLTNLSEEMTADRCKALGAKLCLCKSDLDAEDLWKHVQKLLP